MHGDYHKLDMFDDNSMDIIFGVETLSYASDWNELFNNDIKELYETVPIGIPVWIGHTETLEKWGFYKIPK